jgi:DNA-binding winged helix-turn-helix (wHTH) protein
MREFPPFRLDTVNQCLLRGDGVAEERIRLAPKAFDVLRYLVEHPGRLVAHKELLDALWPKTYERARCPGATGGYVCGLLRHAGRRNV